MCIYIYIYTYTYTYIHTYMIMRADLLPSKAGLEGYTSGVDRGPREHSIRNKGLVRCSLDSCLSNLGNLPP